MKRTTLLLLSGVLATSSGCSIIKSIVESRKNSEIEKLEAAGDYEALSKECAHRDAACKAQARVAERRLQASPCDDLVPNVEKYYRNANATKEGDLALVSKFVECDQTDVLFARSFTFGWLTHSLVELDKKGTDVIGPFVAFLAGSERAFQGEAGVYHAASIAKWLVEVGDASRCPAVDEQLGHVAPEAVGEFLWFFYEAGCGEQALPHARERLRAEAHNHRIQACDIIGKFGDATLLDPLSTLAETDPYKADREVRTSSGMVGIEVYYPVRERCNAAAGQIRLRS